MIGSGGGAGGRSGLRGEVLKEGFSRFSGGGAAIEGVGCG